MFKGPVLPGIISVWAGLIVTDDPTLAVSVPMLILNCLGVVGMEKPFAGKTRCLGFQLVSGY